MFCGVIGANMYFIWEFIVDIFDTIVIGISDRKRWKRKEIQRMDIYLKANADDIRGMADVEVFASAYYQLVRKCKIHKIRELTELMKFNAVQRIFWVLDVYEQKNCGGGILAF